MVECSITRAEVSGTVSRVQATARPDGLSIVASVDLAGSDTAAATFDKSVLPSIDDLINVRLKEWAKVPNVSTMALDPSKLVLSTDSTAERGARGPCPRRICGGGVGWAGESADAINSQNFICVSKIMPRRCRPWRRRCKRRRLQREGTMLLVQGLPLSVNVFCSGLNVLQAMLVAGSLVICLTVPAGWRFGVAAASLLPLAWLANTLRIFMLGCVGLTFGPDFAMDWFHQWGGLAVLLVMFILCQGFFLLLTLEAPKPA